MTVEADRIEELSRRLIQGGVDGGKLSSTLFLMGKKGEQLSPGITVATLEALVRIQDRTPELPSGITSFTPESERALKEEGYLIYPLTGISVEEMRGSYIDCGGWLKDRPKILQARSGITQVAVRPSSYFIPGSGGSGGREIDLAKQKEMVNDLSIAIQEKIPGVKAIVGTAPDYMELSIRHANETNEPFKDEYGTFTRSLTFGPIHGDDVVGVGRSGKGEIWLMAVPSVRGVSNLQIAPIVVPVSYTP